MCVYSNGKVSQRNVKDFRTIIWTAFFATHRFQSMLRDFAIYVCLTHSQMLGKFEYTRGPIFKVVLEC